VLGNHTGAIEDIKAFLRGETQQTVRA
jgi:hypothetical protein